MLRLPRVRVAACLVVFLLAAAGACAAKEAVADFASDTAINERLRFLWERYLEMVGLLISLLTGSIAVSASLIKLESGHKVVDRHFFKRGMIMLMFGLICALVWRISAQLSMEEEVFGDKAAVARYYRDQHVAFPFTTSYRYSDGNWLNKGLSYTTRVLMVGTAAGLLIGLGYLSAFAFRNLPSTNKPKETLAPVVAESAAE